MSVLMTRRYVLNSENLPKLPVISIHIGNFLVAVTNNLFICEYVVKGTVLIFQIIMIKIIGFLIILEVSWQVIDNMMFKIFQ